MMVFLIVDVNSDGEVWQCFDDPFVWGVGWW
jgi:hypothetical protein